MSARAWLTAPNGTEILILVVLLWAGSWLLGRGRDLQKASLLNHVGPCLLSCGWQELP